MKWQEQLIQIIESETKKRKEEQKQRREEIRKETDLFMELRQKNIKAAEALVDTWFDSSLMALAIREGRDSVFHVCYNTHEYEAFCRRCMKENLGIRTTHNYYEATPDTPLELEYRTEIFWSSYDKE